RGDRPVSPGFQLPGPLDRGLYRDHGEPRRQPVVDDHGAGRAGVLVLAEQGGDRSATRAGLGVHTHHTGRSGQPCRAGGRPRSPRPLTRPGHLADAVGRGGTQLLPSFGQTFFATDSAASHGARYSASGPLITLTVAVSASFVDSSGGSSSRVVVISQERTSSESFSVCGIRHVGLSASFSGPSAGVFSVSGRCCGLT